MRLLTLNIHLEQLQAYLQLNGLVLIEYYQIVQKFLLKQLQHLQQPTSSKKKVNTTTLKLNNIY